MNWQNQARVPTTTASAVHHASADGNRSSRQSSSTRSRPNARRGKPGRPAEIDGELEEFGGDGEPKRAQCRQAAAAVIAASQASPHNRLITRPPERKNAGQIGSKSLPPKG
jgi:hypothetical protein